MYAWFAESLFRYVFSCLQFTEEGIMHFFSV